MSLAVAAVVALTTVMPASASERELLRASALESSIVAQINAVRAKHGLAPLKLSSPLSAAARSHSQAMASKGFFSHDSANGSNFSTRVRKWYGPKGYRSWAAGENLLWRSPDVDAAAAVQMWMESPAHRANVLRAAWREVGLGAIHAYAAPGAFGGLEVTVVTADFGTRR
jgi:uncharacterized protein YkwD